MIVTIYDSSFFSYAPAAKTFHGNISEVPSVLRHLYSDDIVTGFGMQSVKTGKVVPFVLSQVVNDSGYEWDKSWVFDVVNPDNLENLRGLRVIVRNC